MNLDNSKNDSYKSNRNIIRGISNFFPVANASYLCSAKKNIVIPPSNIYCIKSKKTLLNDQHTLLHSPHKKLRYLSPSLPLMVTKRGRDNSIKRKLWLPVLKSKLHFKVSLKYKERYSPDNKTQREVIPVKEILGEFTSRSSKATGIRNREQYKNVKESITSMVSAHHYISKALSVRKDISFDKNIQVSTEPKGEKCAINTDIGEVTFNVINSRRMTVSVIKTL